MNENRHEMVRDMVDDAANEARFELTRLARQRDELLAALRWIKSNSDVPADEPNAVVRLRGIHSRAAEAINDDRMIRDMLPEEFEERFCPPSVKDALDSPGAVTHTVAEAERGG